VESLALAPDGERRIREAVAAGHRVVLESDAFEPVVRAIARRLGVTRIVCRRVELRGRRATGRVLPGRREIRLDEPCRPRPVFLPGELPAPFSVRSALAGKRLLVVGASGFIGKVWLASLLRDVPGIGTITLVLRADGPVAVRARLERILASPVFANVDRQRSGATRLDAIAGDLGREGLGIAPEDRERLEDSVDIVINCAGLTEFNPDPRDALAVNVDGPLRLLEIARDLGAGMLHVSTCFVAGERAGRIPEEIRPEETPKGLPFDPVAVREELAELVLRRTGRGSVRRSLIGAARARARELGWPNVYTFTKALGESLLALQRGDVPLAIARPSIVETSIATPPGWNEGINTSAPLAHLLGTAFRQIPVNGRKCLDVTPVDLVATGLTLLTAALAERRAPLVTQLATSATNPLEIYRAVELTSLAHRRHYEAVRSWRARMLARLEAIPVTRDRYQRLSAPRQLRVVRTLNRAWSRVFRGQRAPLGRAEKLLRRATELIELYEPFLLDHEPVFEADHVEVLTAALPVEERAVFGWDPGIIDWYDYWVHVHVPALRRWAYPLMERRPVVRDPEAGAASAAAIANDALAGTEPIALPADR